MAVRRFRASRPGQNHFRRQPVRRQPVRRPTPFGIRTFSQPRTTTTRRQPTPGTSPSAPRNPSQPQEPGGLPFDEDVTQDWLSAYDLFGNILESWGIPMGSDIASIIQNAAIDGIDPSMIELIIPDIQNTATWNNRFPGWKSRVNNGFNQLTVGEYLALEDSYHRILAEAGLPAGFYNDPSDFGNWIANNVSPDEIRDRVGMAMTAVRQVDPTARDLLTKFYGVTPGDLASYFLDQKRALPVLERQFKAANVAAFASRAGLKVGLATRYEDLVDRGLTVEQAAMGYGTVAAFNEAFGRLGSIYGEQFTQEDAEEDVFFNKNDKRRRLLAKEVSTFSGSSRGMTGRADLGSSY